MGDESSAQPGNGSTAESHTNGSSLLPSDTIPEAFEDEGPLPLGDSVYLRCGIDHYQKNIPSSRALVIRGGDGLSVEWSKYASVESTLSRNLKEGKSPADFRVAAAVVGPILAAVDNAEGGKPIFKEVKHNPIQHGQKHGPNRAHSLIVPHQGYSKPMIDKKTKAPHLSGDREFEDAALASLREIFKPA